MADGLVVSGGGVTTVAPDELTGERLSLERLAAELAGVVRELESADGLVRDKGLIAIDAPMSAATAEQRMREAAHEVGSLRAFSLQLSGWLAAAAKAYGDVESSAEAAARRVVSLLGYGAGLLLPLALIVGANLAGGYWLKSLLLPHLAELDRKALAEWLQQNKQLLSDPYVITLIRMAASGADDAIAGAGKVPFPLHYLLGDTGLGLLGTTSSAAAVTALGQLFGLFKDGPVTSSLVSRSIPALGREVAPPTGFAERAARVPPSTPGGPQIRIDRYVDESGNESFEVYIGGTVDFAPQAGDEPFDLTSNMTGLSGLPAGSLEAVEEAMAAEGVGDSPVVFTGYSQGGHVAMQLAESGSYNTQGVVTLGAPTAQPVQGDYPVLAMEHADDIVPAVGGLHRDDSIVLVERAALAGEGAQSDHVFPAHQLDQYRETAALADQADSPLVTDVAARLDQVGQGKTLASSSTYRAERDEQQ